VESVIDSNPTKYNAGMLGKPPNEYAKYIMNPDKWGGDIELDILAQYFNSEIAAADAQSKNIYIFGQDHGYKQRAYLIYSGIHYDAIVSNVTPEGKDRSKDQSTFDVKDDNVYKAVKAMVEEAHKNKEFTNVRNFSLLCEDCLQGLVGAYEASEHAKLTGHKHFTEYK